DGNKTSRAIQPLFLAIMPLPGEIPCLNGTTFLGKFDAYACPSGTPSYPQGATCMPLRGPQGAGVGFAPRGRVRARARHRPRRVHGDAGSEARYTAPIS